MLLMLFSVVIDGCIRDVLHNRVKASRFSEESGGDSPGEGATRTCAGAPTKSLRLRRLRSRRIAEVDPTAGIGVAAVARQSEIEKGERAGPGQQQEKSGQ